MFHICLLVCSIIIIYFLYLYLKDIGNKEVSVRAREEEMVIKKVRKREKEVADK